MHREYCKKLFEDWQAIEKSENALVTLLSYPVNCQKNIRIAKILSVIRLTG